MRKFKKIIAIALSAALSLSMTSLPVFAAATGSGSKTDSELKKTSIEKAFDGSFFSASGFAAANVKDRSQYKEGDEEYRVVNNEVEFFKALTDAKKGIVKVIELKADMNLGWWELSDEAKSAGSAFISAYSGIDSLAFTPLSNPTLLETGLSDMRLSDIDGLTIFSQLGNTIRHAQFQLQSSVNDLVMRNISINEVWEWDDYTGGSGFGSTGGKGNHKRVGWSPVKINGSKNVWFDHCSFGLGFDGCVDIENGAEGISITWCKVGDTDQSVGSMIYKTAMYMEQLYQESKEQNNKNLAFTAYRIMRDNGMSVEDIMEYMAYHSKVHLCGAGDKDTWLVADYDENGNYQFDYSDGMTYTEASLSNITNDLKNWLKVNGFSAGSAFGTIKTYPNFDKTDANERIELSLGYNQYWNVGQRVPMIRGGVGHLYNCYINDYGTEHSLSLINTIKNSEGKTIAQQLSDAGVSSGKLERTMNARNGASIAADTCVWQNVSQPVPGEQYQKDGLANMNSPYHAYFDYNYVAIVNSKVQNNSNSEAYEGNITDNNGNNGFTTCFNWKDQSIGFSWHNLAIKKAYDAEGITNEAVALEKYDKLTYDYQTFPLDTVEDTTNKYSGFNKVKMSASDWLKTSYSSDFEVDLIDESDLADATGVKLDKSEAAIYMDEGEHLQLSATILPSNSKSVAADLVWTSSDESVATVSNCGLVTPHKYGETTITVKLGDFTAECKVSVTPSPSSIDIKNIPSTIYTGDIFTLSAVVSPAGVDNTDVVWNSLTTSLNILDKTTGEFQAVKKGRNLGINVTSKFKANRVGYQQLSVDYKKLKVENAAVPVTGITLDSSALGSSLKAGDSVSLAAAVVPADATNQKIYWTSSDTNVATVDENGNVTAVGEGTAVIEAKTMNWGYVSTCEAVVAGDVVTPTPTPTVVPPTQSPDVTPTVTPTVPPTETPTVTPTATPDITPTPQPKFELGDANMDGKVDLQDALVVLRAALGIENLSDEATTYADVDGDGKITLTDCSLVLKAALGIIELK